MKTRYLLALAASCLYALATPPAQAQAPSKYPPCWPKQVGSTGSSYARGEVEGVQWLGWVCTVDGAPRVFGYVWRNSYQLVEPNPLPETPVATLRAYWAANVREGDPSFDPARLAMRTALLSR